MFGRVISKIELFVFNKIQTYTYIYIYEALRSAKNMLVIGL